VVPDEQGRVRYHYVLVDFLCRRVAGNPAAADDAQEAQWFLQEELAGLELAAETEEVIRKGFERSRARGSGLALAGLAWIRTALLGLRKEAHPTRPSAVSGLRANLNQAAWLSGRAPESASIPKRCCRRLVPTGCSGSWP